jgi:hypothetical protein
MRIQRQRPFFIHFGSAPMNYVASFLAGVFLCNCIPHLDCGLRGAPFPTPFAKPRGVGDSSPLINVLWGFFNLLVGLYLLSSHPVSIEFNFRLVILILGALAMSIYLSLHFGRVHRDKHAK